MKWHENVLTRVFGGGEQKGPFPADPFVKGYGFVYIEPLSKLGDILNAETSLKLSALARSVSITNITLEAESIEGLGGVKFTHPTKLTMPDRVTVEFMEVQNGFVLNTLKRWVSMIRDIRFGASNLIGEGMEGNGNYTRKVFASTMHIIITLPDATTPIQVFCLTGVYPLTIPIEAYSFNITDNTKADLSIEFAFDNFYFADMTEPNQRLNPSNFTSNIGYKTIVQKVKDIKGQFFQLCR